MNPHQYEELSDAHGLHGKRAARRRRIADGLCKSPARPTMPSPRKQRSVRNAAVHFVAEAVHKTKALSGFVGFTLRLLTFWCPAARPRGSGVLGRGPPYNASFCYKALRLMACTPSMRCW